MKYNTKNVIIVNGLFGSWFSGRNRLTMNLKNYIDKEVGEVKHFDWKDAKEIINHIMNNSNNPIVLIGHSQGVKTCLEVAQVLKKVRLRIQAIIAIEPTLAPMPECPNNVKNLMVHNAGKGYIPWRRRTSKRGAGSIKSDKNSFTRIYRYLAPNATHTNIVSNPTVQDMIAKRIKTIVKVPEPSFKKSSKRNLYNAKIKKLKPKPVNKKTITKRDKFIELCRSSYLFRKSLSQEQYQGLSALFYAFERNGVTDLHHQANILAQVFHETGRYMYPIKETVRMLHKDRSPSDATVIDRLDRAFAKGQLPWVKKPYWRDGAFGRGFIQITHHYNYVKFGIGDDYSKALLLNKAADIAVIGMRDGMFTGKKLSSYKFPQALYYSSGKHPRRIVNGVDGTDKMITKHHISFYNILKKANA